MGYYNATKSKLLSEISSIPHFLQADNYPALTGIRGVAIIIVLLYHLALNRFLRVFNWWIFGQLGVDIFFVLSGFLITTLLIKEKVKTNRISVRKFYIRRALRIIPVAYLFLVVMVVINHFFKLHLTATNFISSFLYIKNLPFVGFNDDWTGHFWSLSIEEQFYLIFPLLLLINIKKTTIAAVIIVLGTLIFSLLGFYQVGIFHTVKSLHFICHTAMFIFWEGPFAILIGSLFSILSIKDIINVTRIKQKYFLSAVLFIAAVTIHSKTFVFYTPYLSGFIFDILIGFIILMSIDSSNFFNLILTSRFLTWMGVMSYSFYIWQQIFVMLPLWLMHNHQWGLNLNILFIISDLIRLSGMLASACISYYFFERKFLKLKERFV
jgi:peptidoglycan/LPS O-acetylase OafA/YrhL